MGRLFYPKSFIESDARLTLPQQKDTPPGAMDPMEWAIAHSGGAMARGGGAMALILGAMARAIWAMAQGFGAMAQVLGAMARSIRDVALIIPSSSFQPGVSSVGCW
uniref:Uncharacterized protein n=1 Tax=Candidatus Kentrum sp. FM TaxID=2126340 RepID=A0A450U2H6_9GAMM|nr:MAG: hypothetical protein BECKFM1743C_GA0114222_109672 [Candidatus Kentron sp. FM]VFK23884.1 MAG: hypothetical protein BECKFM1743B_GA0114221_109542 [Candidatus Kentron sp. FM]